MRESKTNSNANIASGNANTGSRKEKKEAPQNVHLNISKSLTAPERAALIIQTSVLTGFSDRYVRYVVNSGERKNEEVLETFMGLWEDSHKNKLKRAAAKLVPLN